jgi:NTP pyrophosphatase (non-canonical NTP hydrolase)
MKVLEKAIQTYGKDMQLTVAVEELSELIKEICKNKRGQDNRKNIIEEMADCYIMLEQLAIIFDIPNHALNEVASQKIERLEKRLAERSENGK